ncbi:MAG: metallophosphoesterase family protein [Kofleriaceae bacterium]|nr:metallophosphoesterase family protein [Kofleriaceae bacterium]
MLTSISAKQLSVALLVAVAFGGCGLNASGNVAANKDGDRSHLAERGSPTEAMVAQCGRGGPTGEASSIKRQPYLQQVTTSSAIVGWTTSQPAGARVEVTKPTGEVVTASKGEEEATLTRSKSEHQMWSKLSGLEPDTLYCYTLFSGDQQITERTGFRTAPTADSTKPIRFLAIGDSGGGGSDQYELREQMDTVPFDMIIHMGDVAYDNGTLQQFDDNVFGVYGELFRNIPFYPVAGNHDHETQKGAPFRAVFNLPGEETYFSYDYGRVHFAAIDTELPYGPQIEWLDKDLAASKAPWKIVYLHHPPYSSGDHGSDVPLRKALAPVVEKHGVQLVLAGHDHHYERMKTQNGVDYIVSGGGGRGTRPTSVSSFTEIADEVIHFMYGEILEDKMVLHAIDGTGREFDALVVPMKR